MRYALGISLKPETPITNDRMCAPCMSRSAHLL